MLHTRIVNFFSNMFLIFLKREEVGETETWMEEKHQRSPVSCTNQACNQDCPDW